MAYRAHPQNMTGSDNPSIVYTDLKYHTDDPVTAIDDENYFLPCRNHFNGAGDEIHVKCSMDDGSWQKATFEVQYEDEHCVIVKQISEWRRGGGRPDLALTAEHKGFGKWDVIYVTSGKPHSRGIPKEEAERLTGKALGKQEAA